MLALASVVVLMGLSFDSVPLPIEASVAPLASIVAAAALPVIMRSSPVLPVTPLLQVVGLFVGYLTVHSGVALFVDVAVRGEPAVRFVAWLRQILALGAGIAVYLVLRRALVEFSDRWVARLLVLGAVPAVALALVNVVWGVTGSGLARAIVVGVRSVIMSASSYTSAYRASGFSFEPSHFAFYLAVIVVPVLIALVRMTPRGLPRYGPVLGAVLLAFVWTFSATGLAILLAVLGAALALARRRLILTAALGAAAGTLIAAVVLVPENYVGMQLSALWAALAGSGALTASALDIGYGIVGPIMRLPESLTSVGYGLGGTATHFAQIVPEHAQQVIMEIRAEGRPALGPLVGRLVAEAGLIGLAMFLAVFVVAGVQLRRLRTASGVVGARRAMLDAAAIGLFGVLVGHGIKHGSFAVPFLWFWLAFVDSRSDAVPDADG